MVRLVEVLTPAPAASWRELLDADPEAVITQTPEWLACICRVGPYRDASVMYVFDDGRRVVLPLARHRHRPARLATEASWPFDWGIGGPLADGPLDTRHTRAVYADLADRGVLQLTLRPGPRTDLAWHSTPDGFRRTEHTTQILDLRGGFERVWEDRFSSGARRAVRKAERAGLEIEVDRTGRLVPTFYELYQQSIVRWAVEQHEPLALARWRAGRANPIRKFHAVTQLLGDRCAVWVARWDGQPAAALVVLRHGEHTKYWRSAMNKELANPTRANQLLHRYAIDDACSAGARLYHMGDSRPDSGLARFKAAFGATPYSSPSYRTERLPLTELDARLRAAAKRCLRFRDA